MIRKMKRQAKKRNRYFCCGYYGWLSPKKCLHAKKRLRRK